MRVSFYEKADLREVKIDIKKDFKSKLVYHGWGLNPGLVSLVFFYENKRLLKQIVTKKWTESKLRELHTEISLVNQVKRNHYL